MTAWVRIAVLAAGLAAHLAGEAVGQAPRPAATAAARQPDTAPATLSVPAASVSSAASVPPPASTGDYYGGWVAAPALLAIVLAIITRQVIVALSLGVLTATGMICVYEGVYNPLRFVTTMMDRFVLGVLAPVKEGRADLEHLTILIYTLFIGAMIGVMSANGGTQALVERITRRVRTRRAAQLGGIVAGLLVFIDDYASAMIVGPGLRPVFDRLRISREKLAHIVNWTAAPVSSMFLGTWLAVQIGWIDNGLNMLGDRTPAFLAGQNGARLFWATIPHRTYCVLALVLLVILALTGRDFGGIRRAEGAALAGGRGGPVEVGPEEGQPGGTTNRWYLAALPGALLVALTIGLMVMTGYEGVARAGRSPAGEASPGVWLTLREVFGKADSHFALLYASLASAVLAIVMSVATRSLSLAKTMDGAVRGMTAMFAATIILVLAWGLSAASKELQLGPVAEEFLKQRMAEGWFSIAWLPVSIFATACLISFATGTSWGTMAILLPPVISISAGLLAGSPSETALETFHACVGAAMAGAVFGNTCSPLADVTVLSATFSGCDLAAHCRTILPQALIVAGVSVACTSGAQYLIAMAAPNLLRFWGGGMELLLGGGILLIIVFAFARRPKGLICEPAVESGG